MKETTLAFSNELSIGVLNCDTLELTRINHVKQDHWIFKTFQVPFDWYWQEDILIIASQRVVPRPNWHRKIYLEEQEIECYGKYLFFFQYHTINNQALLVTSLNLQRFEKIKSQLWYG
ncbi:hypothetical protein [Vagococcus intermedius]|uniref:Uncharacterized protein n=1 Tax=Vagococcus intermedius TaxID=2991418 RepID=A0AAF0I7L0_9ENTE|nr:hypothetical protein [Vagococcus intermedius]WEG73096.1 hypothetical protein OL234_09020 [Vagococcus intermedius]WEG75180.1 hypothetical protein OL235_09015 [Vagococcus intermedius]